MLTLGAAKESLPAGVMRMIVCVAVEFPGECPITKRTCKGASRNSEVSTKVSGKRVFIRKRTITLSAVERTRYGCDWGE